MRGSMGMLVGLAAGIAAGVLIPTPWTQVIEPVGLLWFNALRMTVIPIVMAQLILGVNSQREARALGALGIRAFSWFLGLLLAAALVSAAAMGVALRWMPAVMPVAPVSPPAAAPGLAEWVAGLLPANLIQAVAEGRLLPLIFFSLLFGAALRSVEAGPRQTLLHAIAAVNEAMLAIVGWVMRLAPFGVAALSITLFSRLGSNAAGALGYYVLCFCGIEVAITAILYPLVAAYRVPLRRWAAAVAPIQALAFSSRSSMAALPAMVSAGGNLGFAPIVTRFILPLGASVFRYSTPVSHVTGAIFLAHLYGISLSPSQLLLMVASTLFLSLSSPGIPSGGLLVALPLFHQLGLPPEGLGLLIAADAIPDMCKTAANVTAHMAVAAIVNESASATLGE
ncbi:MAG TPA: dicarboxylate/amino acid:cation symporter [Bryobacteraceae bacterium]|nr:dicarboxylate/amino acid:cation symporter [Bryobacteraceae bacterium]